MLSKLGSNTTQVFLIKCCLGYLTMLYLLTTRTSLWSLREQSTIIIIERWTPRSTQPVPTDWTDRLISKFSTFNATQIFIIVIFIQSNEIHNVVALIKCLLVLRCQLYMFRTVTVHPQELLCRYCMCRLWYVGCDVPVVRAECVKMCAKMLHGPSNVNFITVFTAATQRFMFRAISNKLAALLVLYF